MSYSKDELLPFTGSHHLTCNCNEPTPPKIKNPTAKKNITIVRPSNNRSQTLTPAGAKEATRKAHICAQNHHTVVTVPPGNCQKHPNHHRNSTENTPNNCQTSKTPQTTTGTVLSTHQITARPRKHPKPTNPTQNQSNSHPHRGGKNVLHHLIHRATLRSPPKLRNPQNKTSRSTTKLHSRRKCRRRVDPQPTTSCQNKAQ
jgi:hypothetical protein